MPLKKANETTFSFEQIQIDLLLVELCVDLTSTSSSHGLNGTDATQHEYGTEPALHYLAEKINVSVNQAADMSESEQHVAERDTRVRLNEGMLQAISDWADSTVKRPISRWELNDHNRDRVCRHSLSFDQKANAHWVGSCPESFLASVNLLQNHLQQMVPHHELR